jgi:hypothetical protein
VIISIKIPRIVLEQADYITFLSADNKDKKYYNEEYQSINGNCIVGVSLQFAPIY